MSKYVVALAFLPLLGACATTQNVKTAKNCHIVEDDSTFSHIRTRQVCEEGPVEGVNQPDTRPAPH